jgi:triphosphoribosyl-dephospho-CoA synthase
MAALATSANRAAAPAVRPTDAPLAQRLANLVVGALTDEVTLTPKPGLVDLRGRGAHRDLDWALMCHSAWALHPSFVAMAEAGQCHADPQRLRDAIGHLGRLGEAQMLRATGGVNTHRGAIWAMGLLVTAAACDPSSPAPAAVAARAGALARLNDRAAPPLTGNKGELACRRYGVGGARGQAAADFPHVIEVALPELRRSRRAGDSEDAARLNALLAVMSRLDDTCVLARGGEAALRELQSGASRVLALGGVGSAAGRRALQALDARLLALHVSPGGAADLLAATLFLDRLEAELHGESKGKLHGKTRV